MKTLINKSILAVAIATTLASTAVFAHDIEYTGLVTRTVDGKTTEIAKLYTHGTMPNMAVTNLPPASDVPADLATLNQDSVGKVSFDTAKFTTSKVGDIIGLNYLGISKKGTISNVVAHDNGDTTVILATSPTDNTILTFGPNGVVIGSGSVDGHTYTVSTDANGSNWLVDNTTSGQTQVSLEGDQHVPVTGKSAADIHAAVEAVTAADTYATQAGTTGGTMFAKTSVKQGSVSNVNALIYVATSIPNYATVVNNLVATTNQSYLSSGVNIKLNAAKVVAVVDQTPDSSTSALNILSGGLYTFANLKTDVAAVKPDFVQFIHPLKVAQGMCGVAWLNGGNGQAFSKNYIYSVVSYGTATGVLNGRTVSAYCNNFTQAHELGHNMGMVHDKANSVGVIGHYTDAYGYGATNLYGDIMSYFPTTGYFSTPNLYWQPVGDKIVNDTRFPMGVLNQADTVRGLNLVAPQAALFHTLTR